MRIHSDSLDELEVRKAARLAHVGFSRFSLHGSRKREVGFDIILHGDSGRRQNGGEDEAAAWDQWGIFLGHLFRLDPQMVTPYYADGDDFTWQTGGRFTPDFTPGDCHRSHNWQFDGDSVTGAYTVHTCGGKNGCGTIRRFLHGMTWDEFVAANQ